MADRSMERVLVWSPALEAPTNRRSSLRDIAAATVRATVRLTPIALLLAFVGAIHAINMFDAPVYFDDEGIYVSRAWAVLTSGKLAPYTYFYDHPPLGWFTIAFAVKLLGGFGVFGTSVNAGRVVMLIAHVVSALLVYGITRRLGGRGFAGFFAVLLFGLSPFQILFGRQVLLDNLAVLWMLIALYAATSERLSIWHALLSGAAMGLAVLNKEIVLPMLPGILIVLWVRLHPEIRLIGIAGSLFSALGLVSFYPLYALLKGELLPYGSVLDFSSTPHVSLIGGIMFHQSRASDFGILEPSSLFWRAVGVWWRTDPALVVGLVCAIVMSFLLARRYPGLLGVGLMLVGFLAFLARGAVVFDFWLLAAVPLVAIILALAIDHGTQVLRPVRVRPPIVIRELGRDFRRMLKNEITDAQFFRYIGWAASTRLRRALGAVVRLIPPSIRAFGVAYRKMLRGELTEKQFFANVGRSSVTQVARMLRRNPAEIERSNPQQDEGGSPRHVQNALKSCLRSARGMLTQGHRHERFLAVTAIAMALVLAATAGLSYRTYARSYERVLTHNETRAQAQAIDWLEKNVERDAFLVIDTYAYVDLREFENAHSFWKVDLDSDVTDDLLSGDWRGIDYVALTPVMNSAVGEGGLPLVALAVEHSALVQRFESASTWVEIRRVSHELDEPSNVTEESAAGIVGVQGVLLSTPIVHSELLIADANCSSTVDPADAMFILQRRAGLAAVSHCPPDANGDSTVSILDATVILQYTTTGFVSTLPP